MTSSLGKLFEKIILNRIKTWTESSGLKFPNPLQFGFCKNSGAQLAAWTLQECIHHFPQTQSVLHATFLDNEKAFDRVWQNGLLYKLYKLGIKSKCGRIIRHSYTTACVHVAFQGCISNQFNIARGVGQGRVMSAWLFLVFINDLMNELKMSGYGITMAHIKIPGLLLADDTILLSTTAKGMQILIDILTSYATRWRLKYYPNNSCAILFTNKRNRIIENPLVMGQNKIPNVEETKYAGVLFTNNSSCQSRISNACEKPTKNG